MSLAQGLIQSDTEHFRWSDVLAFIDETCTAIASRQWAHFPGLIEALDSGDKDHQAIAATKDLKAADPVTEIRC